MAFRAHSHLPCVRARPRSLPYVCSARAPPARVQIGAAEREYLAAVREQFVLPMRRFINEECDELDLVRAC